MKNRRFWLLLASFVVVGASRDDLRQGNDLEAFKLADEMYTAGQFDILIRGYVKAEEGNLAKDIARRAGHFDPVTVSAIEKVIDPDFQPLRLQEEVLHKAAFAKYLSPSQMRNWITWLKSAPGIKQPVSPEMSHYIFEQAAPTIRKAFFDGRTKHGSEFSQLGLNVDGNAP